MHNKYKIERATPQFDRRGSTTTIETSFNISPENIQPKLDSVDLKSVNTNLNIKPSSGMENAGADHLYSTALTSNILPKLPNTPSVNLGSTDAGEPNHGYVSDFHNAASVGGRKPSMPVSRALVSTEDKTGGADYTDSAPYSGSLNKNKHGASDTSKDGSGKKTTISENGSASGNHGGDDYLGVMSMEAFYKVPKSMMMLMLGILGFLIILFLLMIIVFAALIASTNSKVKNLETENKEQKAKIEDLELNYQKSSNEELRTQINGLNLSVQDLDGNLEEVKSDMNSMTTKVNDNKGGIELLNSVSANQTSDIDTLSERADQAGIDSARLKNDITRIETDISDIKIDIDELQGHH